MSKKKMNFNVPHMIGFNAMRTLMKTLNEKERKQYLGITQKEAIIIFQCLDLAPYNNLDELAQIIRAGEFVGYNLKPIARKITRNKIKNVLLVLIAFHHGYITFE